MRLYAKLLVMIVLVGALQHYAPPSAWGGETWFALRCHAAQMLGDRQLAAQLVDEYYNAHRTIDEEKCKEAESECRMALAEVAWSGGVDVLTECPSGGYNSPP